MAQINGTFGATCGLSSAIGQAEAVVLAGLVCHERHVHKKANRSHQTA
jgi:ribosomal protein S12 methylthiotransferase accessory factor YcaO